MADIGRPTTYSPELALKICSRIAEGESVRLIVKDEDMPSSSTIFRWLLDEDKTEFWEQYKKARNIQAELMFEELLEIADDGTMTGRKESVKMALPIRRSMARTFNAHGSGYPFRLKGK